jgi:hypothetical protein
MPISLVKEMGTTTKSRIKNFTFEGLGRKKNG